MQLLGWNQRLYLLRWRLAYIALARLLPTVLEVLQAVDLLCGPSDIHNYAIHHLFASYEGRDNDCIHILLDGTGHIHALLNAVGECIYVLRSRY